jgi:hypothetical protein
MNVSMYETALRGKLRFPSERGNLTLEALWEVPLLSRDGFNLDAIAKGINSELKEVSEESFVRTDSNPMQTALELKLDLVKHVISVKLEEDRVARERALARSERAKLLEALERKKDSKLESMTEEQIKARLAELA